MLTREAPLLNTQFFFSEMARINAIKKAKNVVHFIPKYSVINVLPCFHLLMRVQIINQRVHWLWNVCQIIPKNKNRKEHEKSINIIKQHNTTTKKKHKVTMLSVLLLKVCVLALSSSSRKKAPFVRKSIFVK